MTLVLVTDPLSEAGLAILRAAPGTEVRYTPGLSEAELVTAIVGCDALVIRSGSKVTRHVLEAADKLRIVGRAGIGVDNVDVETATRRGILVMNTPTGNAVTTAEHALALLFSIARKIPQATASMKAGRWEKSKLGGRELAGKTLGVVGLGTIGRIVAERARGLRMNVITYDPVLSAERAAQLGAELVGLEELLTRSDAITVHSPLTAETKGLVDDAAVAKMKRGVLLVNCARGGIYDEEALARGLSSGKIGGVALDVFVKEPPPADHPLLRFDNVVATPHLGASTEEAQERVALEICEQVIAFLHNGTIANAVNAPNVARDAAPKLAPYLDLARKLGAFLGQMQPLHARALTVECAGEPAELGAKAVTRAAVAGLLAPLLEAGEVNEVSALHVAAERGVTVRDVRSDTGSRYLNAIVVTVEGDRGELTVVEGVVGSAGDSRLMRWDAYELDARLAGHALVLINEDRPGVIGSVGSVLGRHGVNISQVHLGLDVGTRRAASVWNVDSRIARDVLDEIQRAPHVSRATSIALG